MNEDLLAAARQKRDELRKQASAARLVADEAEAEAHSAEEAVLLLEGLERERREASEVTTA
jgi:hypothetical protein